MQPASSANYLQLAHRKQAAARQRRLQRGSLLATTVLKGHYVRLVVRDVHPATSARLCLPPPAAGSRQRLPPHAARLCRWMRLCRGLGRSFASSDVSIAYAAMETYFAVSAKVLACEYVLGERSFFASVAIRIPRLWLIPPAAKRSLPVEAEAQAPLNAASLTVVCGCLRRWRRPPRSCSGGCCVPYAAVCWSRPRLPSDSFGGGLALCASRTQLACFDGDAHA